jgi:glutamate synthase (NADPH/NADH) large chain
MSGGVAYVYDPDDEFEAKANTGMVSLSDALDDSDEAMLHRLVENHAAYTDSERASWMLDDWASVVDDFVKVMPDAYADIVAERAEADVRRELPESASAVSPDGESGTLAQTSDD